MAAKRTLINRHPAIEMASSAFYAAGFEIFSKLPAKSAFRFRAVCQETNSFMSENLFLMRQWKYMFPRDDRGFFLISPDRKVELHALADDDHNPNMYFGVPSESLEFLSGTTESVDACSNGLVCGKLKEQALLFVCNPVAGSWLSVPLPDGLDSKERFFKVVFECSKTDGNDYFLMVVMNDPADDWSDNHLTRIFSTREGLWKEGGKINVGARGVFNFERPVYDNYNGGLVYFLSNTGDFIGRNDPYYWPYVVCYEIKNSVSQIVPIPKEARKGVNSAGCTLGISRWGSFSVSGSRNSICLIKLRKTVFSVWVLLDANSSQWTMVFKKPAWLMGIKEPHLSVAGFTVINGSMLVIATAERVYQSNLMGNPTMERAKEICRHQCGTSMVIQAYSNTLRPCGHDAKPFPP